MESTGIRSDTVFCTPLRRACGASCIRIPISPRLARLSVPSPRFDLFFKPLLLLFFFKFDFYNLRFSWAHLRTLHFFPLLPHFCLVVTSFPFSAWSLCRAVLAALCFACVSVVVVVSCVMSHTHIAGSDECLYPFERSCWGGPSFSLGRVCISHGGS